MSSKITWIKEPDFIIPDQPTSNPINLKRKPSNTKCVKWVNAPASINELINTEEFFNYLSSSIIFFHNKAPSCIDLIDNRLKLLKQYSQYRKINASYINISSFVNEISTSNNSDTTIIYEINIDDKNKFINLVEYIYSNNVKINCGLWIKGYINSIIDYIPQFFDALFIFDTSEKEFDLVKSKLSISDMTVKFLKENQNDYHSNESVLFYWNYEKKAEAPSLYINPIVLGMGRRLNYQNYWFIR